MTEKRVPKLRFREFHCPWNKGSLSKLIKSLDAGVSVNSSDKLPNNNEASILKTSCISSLVFDPNERKAVVDLNEISRLKEPLTNNSILISRMNTPLLVGASAYINQAPTNTFLPDRLWQVKVYHDICDMKWLSLYLSSYTGSTAIQSNATGTSNSMKNITKNDVLQIGLFFPNKDEQQKIADFLSSVDEKISLLQKQKTAWETYKKGMMQQIFSQKIRFKDDKGQAFPEWGYKSLKDISEKIKLKNKDSKINQVLSNSAEFGIVKQSDFFDKEIANQNNLTGYYVVCQNDFIYNPRISKSAPVGPIKRNHLSKGVMSPLYTVFRFFEGYITFFEYFFKTAYWHEYMYSIANFGARHDRMNISDQDFFELPIPYPVIEEQQKIADFLSSLDDKITALDKQISAAQQWKKGLMQQMFV